MTASGAMPPTYQQFDFARLVDVVRKAGGSPEAVAGALLARGLVVAEAFEIVQEDNLYRRFRSIAYASRQNLPVRFVMCRETHDDLERRYSQIQYHEPPDLMRSFLAGADDSVEAIESTINFVFSRRRWDDTSRLFGVPIRIDPAARTVMFEILAMTPMTLSCTRSGCALPRRHKEAE